MTKKYKPYWLVSMITGTTLLLTGCGINDFSLDQLPYKEIPWQAFLTEEDRQSLEEAKQEPVLVFPVTLDETANRAMVSTWEKATPQLSDRLSEPNFYLEGAMNRDLFDEEVTAYISLPGSELFSEALFKTMGDVYTRPNETIQSLTLTDYSRFRTLPKEKQTVTLSLNTVGDKAVVTQIPITVTLNSQDDIIDVAVGEGIERNNTPRPLSSTAFMDVDTHPLISHLVANAEQEMRRVSQLPTTENKATLFAREMMKQTDMLDITLAEDDDSLASIWQAWMTHSEGLYASAISAVTYSDDGAQPHTTYQITVPNTKDRLSLLVTIDRAEQRIVAITKEEN